MKECPTCRLCFRDDIKYCHEDGAATVPSLPIDPVIDGRYRLHKRIGEGSTGIVFEGQNIFLKTSHAIKIILPELAGDDPDLITRFRQRIMQVAKVRHQNVADIIDFGVIDGKIPFVVRELVQGRTLSEILSKSVAMSLASAMEFLYPIAAGLAAAHDFGVVHGALSPRKVLISDRPSNLKIIGFSFSAIRSKELLAASVFKDSDYIAPEVWSDREVDPRADVYSLGVILCEMLVGAAVRSNWSFVQRQRFVAPPSTSVNRKAELEKAVNHALEVDVAARTPTVADFLKELEAVEPPRDRLIGCSSFPGAQSTVVESVASDTRQGLMASNDVNGAAGPSISAKKNPVTTNIVSVAQPTSGSVARLRNFHVMAMR